MTTDENLAVLYNFAVKRGEINYVYLIDIFKSRLDLKHNPPKRIVWYKGRGYLLLFEIDIF